MISVYEEYEMEGEYDQLQQLRNRIAELNHKIAELEASEEERKHTQEALHKIENHFRLNYKSTSYIPSFLWFSRI